MAHSSHAIEVAAQLAHEANAAYCASIGDTSQPLWSLAPEWQRQSAIKGAEAHYRNRSITPAESHQLWMDEKIANGWTFGAIKDPEARTHPCLVPYDQLPFEQRIKDHIFRSVCHAVFEYFSH